MLQLQKPHIAVLMETLQIYKDDFLPAAARFLHDKISLVEIIEEKIMRDEPPQNFPQTELSIAAQLHAAVLIMRQSRSPLPRRSRS